MTTPPIEAEHYELLKQIPKPSDEQKAKIEAYEAANQPQNDLDADPTHDKGAYKEVTQDENIKSQMEASIALLNVQLPKFKDEAHQKLFALAAKATCLTKYAAPFEFSIRTKDNKDTNNAFTNYLADLFGMLSFDYYKSDFILSKEVKLKQLERKYLTICVAPEIKSRDTTLKGDKDKDIKQGCKFFAYTTTPAYKHKDDSYKLADLKDIFETEELTEKNPVNTTGTAIMGIRYPQMQWIESEGNVDTVKNLIERLKAEYNPTTSESKKKSYQAWSGVLALAWLWGEEHYNQMFQLMNELIGKEPLTPAIEVACGLSVIMDDLTVSLSKYECLIPTTLIKAMLSKLGLAEATSKGLEDLNLALKDNRAGYELKTLQAKVNEVLSKDTDPRIEKLKTTLASKVNVNH